MKIDEAKETIAFVQWKEKTWPKVGTMQGNMLHSAWLARAAQPVTVTREAFVKAFLALNHTTMTVADAKAFARALGIEVRDEQNAEAHRKTGQEPNHE